MELARLTTTDSGASEVSGTMVMYKRLKRSGKRRRCEHYSSVSAIRPCPLKLGEGVGRSYRTASVVLIDSVCRSSRWVNRQMNLAIELGEHWMPPIRSDCTLEAETAKDDTIESW